MRNINCQISFEWTSNLKGDILLYRVLAFIGIHRHSPFELLTISVFSSPMLTCRVVCSLIKHSALSPEDMHCLIK